MDNTTPILEAALSLRDLGFTCHWLHSKQKRPKGNDWQNVPVASAAQLGSSYVNRDNLGVRLGEPSRLTDGNYLHVLDVDIRVPSLAEEAIAKLEELLPGAYATLPMVQSGSGGHSFHLYFVTDKPFRSKRLAVSDGKHRDAEGRWHYDWEIELFGTGKQVVLPPSIHPSGKPYVWVREFEPFGLTLDSYLIPSDDLARLAVAEHSDYAYEAVAPLEFKPGVLEGYLNDVPVSDLHYDDWIRLGQAIHHQLGGGDDAFDVWLEHTKRSTKHDGKPSTLRTMRMKWRSFGKYRGRPVTMATVVQWAQAARMDAAADEFEDLEDLEDAVSEGALGDADFSQLFDDVEESAGKSEPGDGDSGRADTFDDKPKLPWRSLLDLTEEGGHKATLHNLKLIVANDPRFRKIIRRNMLSQSVVRVGKPGKLVRRDKAAKPTVQLDGRIWTQIDKINGDTWTDDHDAAVRSVIEAPTTQGGYGMKVTDRDLMSAIRLASSDNSFHPVQDYLMALTWDGTPRLETMFIDYLRTPDNAYYRNISRLTMVAAVTRVFEPGHKWDSAPIIEGLQGRRKSTFIKILGKHWSAELDGDFSDDKLMIEKMHGKWIMEMPELSSFSKAEVNHIKAFMSREEDRARLAYERRSADFPRQCIFIGTTNDKKYLKDETGGRRFWPVECGFGMDAEIDTEKLEREIDQIWAEAYVVYRQMRAEQPIGTLPLYLRDREAARIANTLQESRRIITNTDTLAGMIEEWLQTPVHSGDITEKNATKRMKTCAMDVWVHCFGKDRTSFPPADRNAIIKVLDKLPGWKEVGQRRFDAKVGRQIAYIREGSE